MARKQELAVAAVERTPAQEVMTIHEDNARKAHDTDLTRWRGSVQAQRRSAALCALLAASLWLLSYWASSLTGPVNQSYWYSFLTLATFAAAGILSIVCVVLLISAASMTRPVLEPVYEEIPRERDME